MLTLLQHLSKAFAKVSQLFKQNLAVPAATSSKSGTNTDGDGVVTMAQDLLQVLLPYLGRKDAQTLFELSSTEDVLENKDTGVQKRGYKLLGKLVESGKIEITPENFIQLLEGRVGGVSAAAKKVRAHYVIVCPGPLMKIYRIDCTCFHFSSTCFPIHRCICFPP